MATDSTKRRGGADIDGTGGALSSLLAEEDEFDRRALWRLGTWAVVATGTLVGAFMLNQSTIGARREHTASADLLRQAQQLQLTARESQGETRRLASAIDTLNGDRDRLFSRIAVLEQGLDSVTGAIARQGSTPHNPNPPSSKTGANAPPVGASTPAPPATVAAPAVSATPVATVPADTPPAPTKPPPAPAVGPVAATAPAVVDKAAEKQDKQVAKLPALPDKPPPATEPAAAVASLPTPQPAPAQQPASSLVASKSMIGPPDPVAGKLIETAPLPKVAALAPTPDVAAITPKAPPEAEPDPIPAAAELKVQHTEFGVDIGGANSIAGLRALWRGLIKSRSNAALTKLRPVIAIKENTNGLGMQLRLVAGPISDAAAAAKICASLTVNDRGCATTVFEGQRLAVNAEESADKTDAGKPEADGKSDPAPSKPSPRKRYYAAKPQPPPKVDEPPKPEPSTLSLIFGKR